MNRYSAQGKEVEFEPGSRGRVLRNLLGVRSVREIQRYESEALLAVTQHMIDVTSEDQKFTADDIRQMHHTWLGKIYPWAGEFRQVNISKGSFHFASALQVPKLMHEFEKDTLARLTPCRATTINEQAHALAEVHVELVLIHQFREGNGRCARLLSILMATNQKRYWLSLNT